MLSWLFIHTLCYLASSSTFSFFNFDFISCPNACLHLFRFSLSLPFFDSCQIFKVSPCAPFLCTSMCWWALNNIHSQQTFKRAWLASYMMGWCAVLLLGVLVFWCTERKRGREKEREMFGSVSDEPYSAPVWKNVWDMLSHAAVLPSSLCLSVVSSHSFPF